MSMTRNQLRQRISRNLGGGMVKTELCVEHYDDAINTARDLWITWAAGNATMEVYFLLLLKGGQHIYDLPAGLTEVVNYTDHMGGVGMGGDGQSFGGYGASRWMTGPEQGNTAIHVGYPGWQGMGYSTGGYGDPVNGVYTLVDSYLAMASIDLWKQMRHDKYQWRYHRFVNQLEIIPTPECGNSFQAKVQPSGGLPPSGCPNDPDVEYETIDSPGYVMLKGYMMEGCSLPTYVPCVSGSTDPDGESMYPAADENYLEFIFSHPWIIAYSTAHARETLGIIRRKFANNTSLGNASISLDGDALVQEGREDKQRLEEELDLKYSLEGYGILMG